MGTSKDSLFIVGQYTETFNDLTEQHLPCGPVYQSEGLRIHVQKRHPECLSCLDLVPQIIAAPDYVGRHPRESNSIELVKVIDQNIMVCIKLDIENDYLFVASVYEISNGKLNNRLNSGRLKSI